MWSPRRDCWRCCDEMAPSPQPTDMRKGFDGLSALVTQGLQRDPPSGDAFIFVSRDRVRAKVLQWDGTGLCISSAASTRDCTPRQPHVTSPGPATDFGRVCTWPV
jgi:transposase